MKALLVKFGAAIAVMAMLFAAVPPAPAHAAGILVNTATDEDMSNTSCSLREAIIAANGDSARNGCSAGSGPDTITFAGDYTITLEPGLGQLPAVTVNSTITITGNGASRTIVQAPDVAMFRAFQVNSGGNLTLEKLAVRNGRCFGGCTPPGNNGGAIHNAGSLTIRDGEVSGNSAAAEGGAIYNAGALTIERSTFSGNSSSTNGGGIFSWSLGPLLPVAISNSTFSGNSAPGQGGAILNSVGSSLTLTNDTLSGNTASMGGGVYNAGTMMFPNTIIANSSGGDCVNSGGTVNPSSVSLAEDASCFATRSGDPVLGSFAYNGGETKTMALLAGSPAIDAADTTACMTPPVNHVDQRGLSRPRGPSCDIGAFERSPDPAAFTNGYESDIVLYRSGAWQFYDFASGAYMPGSSKWTGDPGGACIPAPMDYDGDAKKEFTQLCGTTWHFYNDDGSYLKGIVTVGGYPVPADYNGDRTEDVVVFNAGAWQHYNFATGAYADGVWTGDPGGVGIPVPMDYNGDGSVDRTILSGGAWHFYYANGSYNKGIWVGNVAGQLAVPGDYNGDGTDEPWIFRSGAWLYYDFSSGLYNSAKSVWTGAPVPPAGGGATKPAPLDYDGDGKLDLTVFAGGPWHFYNADGSYNKGIWVGKDTADVPISRRPLP